MQRTRVECRTSLEVDSRNARMRQHGTLQGLNTQAVCHVDQCIGVQVRQSRKLDPLDESARTPAQARKDSKRQLRQSRPKLPVIYEAMPSLRNLVRTSI